MNEPSDRLQFSLQSNLSAAQTEQGSNIVMSNKLSAKNNTETVISLGKMHPGQIKAYRALKPHRYNPNQESEEATAC